MGFSLKYFFETLEDILNSPFLSELDRNERLRLVIEESKQYAKECGQLA